MALLEALAENQDRENAALVKRCRLALRSTNAHGRDFILSWSAAEAAFANGFFATPAVRADLWRVAYQLNNHLIGTPEMHPAHPRQGLNRTVWTPDYCEAALLEVIAHRDWLADLLNGTFVLPEWTDYRLPFNATSYFRLSSVGPEPTIGAPALDMSLGLDLSAAAMPTSDETDDKDEAEDAELEADTVIEPVDEGEEPASKEAQDEQLSFF